MITFQVKTLRSSYMCTCNTADYVTASILVKEILSGMWTAA